MCKMFYLFLFLYAANCFELDLHWTIGLSKQLMMIQSFINVLLILMSVLLALHPPFIFIFKPKNYHLNSLNVYKYKKYLTIMLFGL